MDITPSLYKDIKADFDKYVKNDATISKIKNGGGTLTDVSRVSQRIGIYATNSLIKNLTTDRLPNGILYWNIAQGTIVPIMRTSYELIFELASAVQKREDEKNGISIKPIKPKFPLDRVNEAINRLMVMEELTDD